MLLQSSIAPVPVCRAYDANDESGFLSAWLPNATQELWVLNATGECRCVLNCISLASAKILVV